MSKLICLSVRKLETKEIKINKHYELKKVRHDDNATEHWLNYCTYSQHAMILSLPFRMENKAAPLRRSGNCKSFKFIMRGERIHPLTTKGITWYPGIQLTWAQDRQDKRLLQLPLISAVDCLNLGQMRIFNDSSLTFYWYSTADKQYYAWWKNMHPP